MNVDEASAAFAPVCRHLLVPLDGTRMAESVLPVASALAERCAARVTLLHVVEAAAPPKIHGEPHLVDAEQATAYLEAVAGRLRAEGIAVAVHVHGDRARDVAGGVVDHAIDLGADLILLATHGRGGLFGAVVGSIAEQALGRGKIPVLLIRPEMIIAGKPFAIHRILVPLDGTPDAEPALPLAEAMARAWEAELVLLRVVPTRGSLPGHHAAVATLLPSATRLALEMERAAAADYLRELGEGLAGRGTPTSGDVLRGEPAAVVAKAAQARRVDLVVMATHGRSGMDAFWTGSVGSRLIKRLDVPLLVIRTDRTA